MLKKRASEPEILDSPDLSPQQVADTFHFLLPVNRWLGGIQPELQFLKRESKKWDPAKTYRLLDAGCGVGDVPLALVRWSRRQGYRLQVDAVDMHHLIIERAREKCQGYPEISFFCQDVFQFAGQGYDYVHAAQFLHHFSDQRVPSVLNYLLLKCQGKLVINDLLRVPLFYLATWLATVLASPTSRHDARLSVRKGFRMGELKELLEANGFRDFELNWHFFYRFLLVIEREQG
jgi:2-polyprenyl-3-methyl-5-hydroxy-6-metoxy-1,4-benzoquinol methylase